MCLSTKGIWPSGYSSALALKLETLVFRLGSCNIAASFLRMSPSISLLATDSRVWLRLGCSWLSYEGQGVADFAGPAGPADTMYVIGIGVGH